MCTVNSSETEELKCLLDHEKYHLNLLCLHSMYNGMRDPPMGRPVQPYR